MVKLSNLVHVVGGLISSGVWLQIIFLMVHPQKYFSRKLKSHGVLCYFSEILASQSITETENPLYLDDVLGGEWLNNFKIDAIGPLVLEKRTLWIFNFSIRRAMSNMKIAFEGGCDEISFGFSIKSESFSYQKHKIHQTRYFVHAPDSV